MVQGGMTAAVTRARSWCARQVQAAVESEKLEWLRASLWEGGYEMTK